MVDNPKKGQSGQNFASFGNLPPRPPSNRNSASRNFQNDQGNGGRDQRYPGQSPAKNMQAGMYSNRGSNPTNNREPQNYPNPSEFYQNDMSNLTYSNVQM